jgi:hypothetical protein
MPMLYRNHFKKPATALKRPLNKTPFSPETKLRENTYL